MEFWGAGYRLWVDAQQRKGRRKFDGIARHAISQRPADDVPTAGCGFQSDDAAVAVGLKHVTVIHGAAKQDLLRAFRRAENGYVDGTLQVAGVRSIGADGERYVLIRGAGCNVVLRAADD